MPGSRNLDRRTARAWAAAERLARAQHAHTDGRRRDLEFLAGIAALARDCAAAEDMGPGLARAFELGDSAVAELGYVPIPRALTAEEIARIPQRPPPQFVELWRKLEQLWRMDDRSRPPQTVAEVLVRCLARHHGGQFPFLPQNG